MSTARLPWIAADPASLHLLELAQKVAETDTTLLITGASGTGKDHLARLVHELGARRDAPYLKIDCASLPSELVESELFGHEKGAFTGAVSRKLGRFEMAQGGTIVLDEIAALAPASQSKLLRVLEERRFERLGGTETLSHDARLIALTNADLTRAVAAGLFREDLFFRLHILVLSIPPLSERKGDILPLAKHFIGRIGAMQGKPGLRLDPTAALALENYSWPGNIRELRNALEYAVVFAKGDAISAESLPDFVRRSAAGGGLGLRSLEEIEKDAIKETLQATHYKIVRAAEILGISRKTLLEKRKKYGLE